MNTIVKSVIVVGITFASIALAVYAMVEAQHKDLMFEDCHDDLLYCYEPTKDIPAIVSGENIVDIVNTDYSVLYQNSLKRKMFVFSSQVRQHQESEYAPYDRSFQETSEENVILSSQKDIKIDQRKIEYGNRDFKLIINMDEYGVPMLLNDSTNRYGSTVDMIQYESDQYSIAVSATYGGLMFSIDLITPVKEIGFPILCGELKWNNENAGYCVFEDKEEDRDVFVCSRPLTMDENGENYSLGKASVRKKGGEYYLLLSDLICKNGNQATKVVLLINMEYEKMFYDSTAYAEKPLTNYIYDFYSVLRPVNSKTSGYIYLKFNMRSFTPKTATLLDRAVLHMYVFGCTDKATLEVYSVRNDWCSWEMSWLGKAKYYEKIGEFTVSSDGWYGVDLTSFFIRTINNDYYGVENNSVMIKLKDGEQAECLIHSCDHSETPPYFEIDYRVK